MQPVLSRRLAMALLALATFIVLAGLVAARNGQPLQWYAAGTVLALGGSATSLAASWMVRRPWHLERAPGVVSLENLKIVPHYYLERLAALGIFTVTSLRRADPEWAALGIGATPDMVQRWQARAELHLLSVREEVLGWQPGPDERWPDIVPGTGAFGRGPARREES